MKPLEKWMKKENLGVLLLIGLLLLVIVAVLPDPGPARSIIGPLKCRTAFSWALFIFIVCGSLPPYA